MPFGGMFARFAVDGRRSHRPKVCRGPLPARCLAATYHDCSREKAVAGDSG